MSHTDHEHKHQTFVPPMTNTPIQVPLHQTVQTGIELLRNPKYNKGLAFTWEERHVLRLQGLLPPVVRDQEEQLLHIYDSLDKCHSALDKFIYIMGLLDRNEKLFYRALIEKITQLMPIVYTPTVGLVCQKYGSIFRVQRGMYVSLYDRGNVLSILNNWPERQVRAIVLTDGERILGLGDLGANGMGIPVGKLALYTACGGLDPSILLPITVDVGTDNETLLGDPFYMGLRQKRERGPAYDELIDEFVKAVKIRFGPYTLLQFEDFGNHNAFRFMEKYRNQACTFNDDIQGTAAVVVAGVVASCRLNEMKLSQHVYVFFGAGEAGIGAARLLTRLISEEESIPIEHARRNIWMVDSKGLVAKGRKAGGIEGQKAEFAREFPNPNLSDLTEIVQSLRATALFGLSGQPNVFTESVCRAMAANTEQPLIFPLSNPTSKSECTAEQAYGWTEGRCIFASGSPFPPYQHTDKLLEPGQANNCYIFPGMALAVVSSGARRVTDDMFLVAAKSLASQVSSDDLSAGSVFPPLKNIREVSAHVAADICDEVYRLGLATVMPKPDDMLAYIKERMYTGQYPSYTSNTSNAYNQYE